MKLAPRWVGAETILRIGSRQQRHDDVLKVVRAGREHPCKGQFPVRVLRNGVECAKPLPHLHSHARPYLGAAEPGEIGREYSVQGKGRIDQKYSDGGSRSVLGSRLAPQMARDHAQWLGPGWFGKISCCKGKIVRILDTPMRLAESGLQTK